ncbi:MAG: hypothetical protein JXX29_04205 [Deltaproteobacteria bacterium]|nr:hypothetical protein [Deltaproteobacteria bacterium]MBN2670847.1 hypothetical protein [Deltaproteobacteria bacterium]
MPITETLEVTQRVANIFKQLGARYVVGGSVASSMHGIPRATQDVDMVVQLFSTQVPKLLELFSSDFYIDETAVIEAINRSASFNIIHLETMYKIDVFVCGDDELKHQEFERAIPVTIDEETQDTLFIADATDIIIQKLLWYELGNRISQRQWNDVIGVLKVSRQSLDMSYLQKWSIRKKIIPLVKKAFKEALAEELDW